MKKVMPKTKTNKGGTPKAKTVGKKCRAAAGTASPTPKTPKTKSPLVPSPNTKSPHQAECLESLAMAAHPTPKESQPEWKDALLHIPEDLTMGYWMEASLGHPTDGCLDPKILAYMMKMKVRDVFKEIILYRDVFKETILYAQAGRAMDKAMLAADP